MVQNSLKLVKSDTQTSNYDSCESNSSAKTLESYESESDDEYVIQPSKEQEKPSFAFVNTVQHVKTPRETVKEQNTYSPQLKQTDILEWFNAKSQAVSTSAARKVNAVRPIVNENRPRNNFHKSHSPIRRPFNRTTAPRAKFSNQKVNTEEVKDKSSEAKNKGEKHTKDTGLKTNEEPVDQEDQAFLEELNKGSGEKGGSTEELVSTAVPKTVSTARPELSTTRPDVDAAWQEDSAVEPRTPPTITNIKDSSRPARSILTLKPLPIIDPKDKGRSVLEEPEPAKKMTRSDFDVAQIARDAKVARQLQVDLQAEVERERQREEEASKAAIAETYDEVQARIDADALFAAKLQQEEREEYTIKERAKFLAETITAQRKFKAAQRSAEIRSRPPTKSQLRNLMMTYLKNMGGYKHSQLKSKTFAEIQDMEQSASTTESLDLMEVLGRTVLWGDLRTMFDANAEDELWQNQERWNLKSWIYMKIVVLVAGTASEDAYTLLRFIQKQIDEYESHDGGEKDL
ncbi:hypothetical protein Tco_0503419 [Tanacetum coccineum]